MQVREGNEERGAHPELEGGGHSCRPEGLSRKVSGDELPGALHRSLGGTLFKGAVFRNLSERTVTKLSETLKYSKNPRLRTCIFPSQPKHVLT